MRLTLVRHGIAIDRDDPGCPPEAERFLTREGTLRTRQAMRGLRALGLRPDEILTSPYVRAAQTASIAARALGVESGRIRTTSALLPMADPERLFEELRLSGSGSVVCCGHAPGIDRLVAFAVGAARPVTALKKAGAAALEVDPTHPGDGLLVWVAPPRLLRKLGGAGRDACS